MEAMVKKINVHIPPPYPPWSADVAFHQKASGIPGMVYPNRRMYVGK